MFLRLRKEDMGVACWIGLVGIAHHSIHINQQMDERLRKKARSNTKKKTKDGIPPFSFFFYSYQSKQTNKPPRRLKHVHNRIDDARYL